MIRNFNLDLRHNAQLFFKCDPFNACTVFLNFAWSMIYLQLNHGTNKNSDIKRIFKISYNFLYCRYLTVNIVPIWQSILFLPDSQYCPYLTVNTVPTWQSIFFIIYIWKHGQGQVTKHEYFKLSAKKFLFWKLSLST